ncbi:adenylate kinase [Pseudolycoriella hygida]|uniref:Adenylate kinase n=1 Tax=Pseudolycoriella hygida TaxID=35572 RepID=A0A9Q0N8L8_9DIPT|nr:adenylate kinase [Pseudolycoriella hygida]
MILMGPPGSGKGTQGKLLGEKLSFPHVSIGDIFRNMVEAGNKEGELLQEYMVKGALAPSKLVNDIVKKFLTKNGYEQGCILDGYPRNLEQAKFLNDFIKCEIKILFFEVANQTILKRILGRFSCIKCGQIYNQFFIKPKIEGVCDICSSNEFIHRQDDDEETVKQRIQEYKMQTYPLLDYYKNDEKLYIVDANKNKEDIEFFIDKLLKII